MRHDNVPLSPQNTSLLDHSYSQRAGVRRSRAPSKNVCNSAQGRCTLRYVPERHILEDKWTSAGSSDPLITLRRAEPGARLFLDPNLPARNELLFNATIGWKIPTHKGLINAAFNDRAGELTATRAIGRYRWPNRFDLPMRLFISANAPLHGDNGGVDI